MMTETIYNGMEISDFITRNTNTIEGLPRSGRGYLVTGIRCETTVDPVIEVEMNPDAFRAAIGYLNRPSFSAWTGPELANKKKKPVITKVIYNPPATIVWFNDGDKIVSKADEVDKYNWEYGLALCILKKRMDKKTYNRLFPYFDACDVELKKDADGKLLRNKKGMVIIVKSVPLWDVLVRMNCPNGEWEKIKKEWKK